MSEWKEYKLGNFFTVKHGYAFNGEHIVAEETNNILVTPGNFFIGGGFKSDKFKYYNGDIPQDYILKEGDIIVTMTDLSKDSDTLGYSAKVPSNENHIFLHNQRIGLVVFKNKNVSRNFFYWLMRTKKYQQYIVGSASGTSIMHTSPSRIENYECLIPSDVSEQKQIAGILGSLDDKIDLLNRENKTLETMAETLFRKWFVEDANEDWKEKPLSYFGEIICGKTPSKKKYEFYNGNIPFVKIPDMHKDVFVFQSEDSLSELGRDSQKNKTLPPKSILVSCIATVGLVAMNAFVSQTNQQINSIVPYKSYYRYFLYLIMKSMCFDLQVMASGGTATLNLNTGDFSKISICCPNDDYFISFNTSVEQYFNKIYMNQKQIITLNQLRNVLLPKLMNSEVRVKE